jgi:hypothetical protein
LFKGKNKKLVNTTSCTQQIPLNKRQQQSRLEGSRSFFFKSSSGTLGQNTGRTERTKTVSIQKRLFKTPWGTEAGPVAERKLRKYGAVNQAGNKFSLSDSTWIIESPLPSKIC